MTAVGAAAGTSTVLRCRSVTVELGGQRVVDRIDLDLRAGEWLGVIGPNGAGKTSLLRAVGGLVRHGGEIAMPDGHRPGPTDLALVPQKPLVPEAMSVAEYVLMGRTAHLGWFARESEQDLRIVASILERLALDRFSARAMGALSGGEVQRVVIARSLAQQAPILLLDEPTSSLDLGHQTAVLELVDQLRREDGLSILTVMHDLTTAARFADRLVLLDAGRQVVTGPAEDVMTAEVLSRVYRTPLTVRRIDGRLVVLPATRSTAS